MENERMEDNKKRLKREYKQNPPPMGVFAIRNMVNDKVFVGVSQDLSGIINRHKFQLKMGKHQNVRLQTEWNEFGEDKFAFEILEQVEQRDVPHSDYRGELALLEELWLEKLQPFDDRGYNEPKISREERLRRMAAKRTGDG
jgi:group I intron endonuclease